MSWLIRILHILARHDCLWYAGTEHECEYLYVDIATSMRYVFHVVGTPPLDVVGDRFSADCAGVSRIYGGRPLTRRHWTLAQPVLCSIITQRIEGMVIVDIQYYVSLLAAFVVNDDDASSGRSHIPTTEHCPEAHSWALLPYSRQACHRASCGLFGIEVQLEDEQVLARHVRIQAVRLELVKLTREVVGPEALVEPVVLVSSSSLANRPLAA